MAHILDRADALKLLLWSRFSVFHFMEHKERATAGRVGYDRDGPVSHAPLRHEVGHAATRLLLGAFLGVRLPGLEMWATSSRYLPWTPETF